MKKINNKGFTLVELLAMLTVLGILMAVTIPNISGILNSNKINMLKSDARKMVDLTKVKVAKNDKLVKPKVNECYVYSLNSINTNDDIMKGPNGGEYDQFDSFVVYTRVGKRYKYYVRLVENNDLKYYGIALSDVDNLTDKNNTMVNNITSLIGLEKGNTNNVTKVKTFLQGKSICSAGVKSYDEGRVASEVAG